MQPAIRRIAVAIVPYVVLLAGVVVFHRQVLFTADAVIPWDFRYFHFPNAAFIADALAEGRLPLWDPFTYCGRPFFADIQMQAFYPPLLATAALSNQIGQESLFFLLELDLIAHIFVAGVLAFLLLRELGLRPPAAVLGAIVFELGGFFASQTQHLVHTNAASWLPLAWLGVVMLSSKFTWRRTALVALAFAMSFLAGYPPVTIVVIGSSLLLAAVLFVLRRMPAVALGAVGLAIVWGLLLAAIQFLPALQLNSMSIGQYRTDFLGTGGGLPPASLVSLVAPNYYGIFNLETYRAPYQLTFLYVYCSIGGLILAVLAPFVVRDWRSRAFGIMTFLSVLWMLGDSTPVGVAVYKMLPSQLKNSMHPEYAMCAFGLSMAVLAALATDRIFRKPVLGWVAVLIVAVDLIAVGSNRPMNTRSASGEPMVARDHLAGNRELLARVRGLVNQTVPPARIDTVADSMLWAQTAHLTRVPTANGNDPQALARLIQVRLAFCEGERWGAYYQVARPQSPILALLNVRYVISQTPIANARDLGEIAGRHIYEVANALPRFFLVESVKVANNLNESVQSIRSPEFRPASEAVVEGSAAPRVLGGGTARVIAYRPEEVTLEVDAVQPSFLVTSEVHYPGWRAWIDGREASIAQTNVAFRGLAVPAGVHRVVMRFQPAILWWSAAVSAVAWAAFAPAMLPWHKRMRHRSSREQAAAV